MKELEKLRTSHSKTFHLEARKYQTKSFKNNIHVKKNNKFVDIDTSIKKNKIRDGIYDVDISKNKIGFKCIDKNTNKGIEFELLKIGNDRVNYKEPKIEKNTIIWEEVSPGVDIKFIFLNYKTKIFRILKNDKANKKAVWGVTEDDGDKELFFKNNFFGWDSKNRTTIHTLNISEKKNGFYEVVDIFEGKVYDRDLKNRVKKEIEPIYPVYIDPSVDVFIDTSNDDGSYYRSTYGTAPTISEYSSAANFRLQILKYDSTGTYSADYKSYTKFNGITIPQGSIINSATINFEFYAVDAPIPFDVTIDAKNLLTVVPPSNFAEGFSPGTLLTFDKKTSITSGMTTKSMDVTDLVQELVNSYDYDNNSMMFFFKTQLTGSQTNNRADAFSYDGWGQIPELVINYTINDNINLQPTKYITGVEII